MKFSIKTVDFLSYSVVFQAIIVILHRKVQLMYKYHNMLTEVLDNILRKLCNKFYKPFLGNYLRP